MADIAQLIHKYLKEECSEEELQQLQDWQQQSEHNRRIFNRLTDDEYLLQAVADHYKIDPDEVALEKINARIDAEEQAKDTAEKAGNVRWIWPRLSVAAAILVLLATSTIYILHKNQQGPGITQSMPANQDVAPGGYKATLQLADGRSISLDSASTGQLAQQGSTQVLNKNGQLVYTPSRAGGPSDILWNTLSTSKGQTYPLLLTDGSRITLNAESSIRFPVTFTGDRREVQVTGEVYFQVAHDAARPFTVTAKDMDLQVLGTTFNVNAYNDEESVKTTLVEGSILVKKGIQQKVIRPGQQAQVLLNDIKVTEVDVDKAIAWKQGFFRFKEDKLSEAMKNIARWYNIEVVFEGNAADVDVSGDIPRTANLSELVRLLAVIDVTARIEGKKLVLKAQ
jgi:transmembrane sensor